MDKKALKIQAWRAQISTRLQTCIDTHTVINNWANTTKPKIAWMKQVQKLRI